MNIPTLWQETDKPDLIFMLTAICLELRSTQALCAVCSLGVHTVREESGADKPSEQCSHLHHFCQHRPGLLSLPALYAELGQSLGFSSDFLALPSAF